MATRQYVGARYVPKFYVNDLGGNDWDDLHPYEPLTIVSHLGNSYTSKKPVPIGVSIHNTEYWVLTGNYNAQVEEYRMAVDEYRSGKKVIYCVGDSYSNGADTDDGKGWIEHLSIIRNLTYGTDVFYSTHRTGGFIDDGSQSEGGTNYRGFIPQIRWGADNLSADEKEKITDIIVAGGWNDNTASYETLFNHASTFNSVVRESFPNAKVTLMYIGGCNTPSLYPSMKNTISNYKKLCIALEWKYAINCEFINRDFSLYGTGTRSFHPNTQIYSAEQISYYLDNGNCNVSKSGCNIAVTSDISGITNIPLTVEKENNTTFIQFGSTNFNISIDNYLPAQERTIGTITGGCFIPGPYDCYIPVVMIVVHGTNTWTSMPAYIHITGNDVKIQAPTAHDSTGTFTRFNNVSKIYLYGSSSVAINSLKC